MLRRGTAGKSAQGSNRGSWRCRERCRLTRPVLHGSEKPRLMAGAFELTRSERKWRAYGAEDVVGAAEETAEVPPGADGVADVPALPAGAVGAADVVAGAVVIGVVPAPASLP